MIRPSTGIQAPLAKAGKAAKVEMVEMVVPAVLEAAELNPAREALAARVVRRALVVHQAPMAPQALTVHGLPAIRRVKNQTPDDSQ